MCHFVTQGFADRYVVGPQHDGARLGESEARSPIWHATAGHPAEFFVVGDENQPDGAEIDPAQRGPFDGSIGDLCQGDGQIDVTRPTHRGDVADLGCRRLRLLLQGAED
jgi:hypothetical protein